jgi:hypothetical protein
MNEYGDLLEQARSRVSQLKRDVEQTAKEFIPKMYNALRTLDPYITPTDAGKRTAREYGNLERYYWNYQMRTRIQRSKKLVV